MTRVLLNRSEIMAVADFANRHKDSNRFSIGVVDGKILLWDLTKNESEVLG